jgi:glycosyltransferase involved in cell wall biosynthesis
MICLLHGYLLEGSGSNLWTRSVLQALCRTGETVHLVCQEPHPEIYDFIAAVSDYPEAGGVAERWTRDVPYPGRCIMHKPALGDLLPVYVWDEYEEFTRVVPMVDLSSEEIEAYIARNVEVVDQVVRNHGVSVIQANHVVLMSVVAQRVAERSGIPFAVMPHGSALEYAVRPDRRFHALASGALAAADRILVSADELRERVITMFPALPELGAKIDEIRVGVDTAAFQPIEREDRPGNIRIVAELLQPGGDGRSAAQSSHFLASLRADSTPQSVHDAMESAARYDGKYPDQDAAQRLQRIPWIEGDVAIFVGRLIAAKGIHCLIAALPEILIARPSFKLVVAGHGPLREHLEALLFALRSGQRGLARHIALGDPDDDRLAAERLKGVPEYWRRLEETGRLEAYHDAAERLLREDTVQFVGYMTHRELQWIFPCCDVGVFPSMVKESGPMVFLEALSSGCFPVGSYYAGTGEKIDVVTPWLDSEDAEWMKVRHTPEHMAADLARVLPNALAVASKYRAVLRSVAEREYDWKPIAANLARALHALAEKRS